MKLYPRPMTDDEHTQIEMMIPYAERAADKKFEYRRLVDSRTKVTVVLKTGEELRGRIRYYDRHCFSIGLSAEGPRLFLRKASVSHISED